MKPQKYGNILSSGVEDLRANIVLLQLLFIEEILAISLL